MTREILSAWLRSPAKISLAIFFLSATLSAGSAFGQTRMSESEAVSFLVDNFKSHAQVGPYQGFVYEEQRIQYAKPYLYFVAFYYREDNEDGFFPAREMYRLRLDLRHDYKVQTGSRDLTFRCSTECVEVETRSYDGSNRVTSTSRFMASDSYRYIALSDYSQNLNDRIWRAFAYLHRFQDPVPPAGPFE